MIQHLVFKCIYAFVRLRPLKLFLKNILLDALFQLTARPVFNYRFSLLWLTHSFSFSLYYFRNFKVCWLDSTHWLIFVKLNWLPEKLSIVLVEFEEFVFFIGKLYMFASSHASILGLLTFKFHLKLLFCKVNTLHFAKTI